MKNIHQKLREMGFKLDISERAAPKDSNQSLWQVIAHSMRSSRASKSSSISVQGIGATLQEAYLNLDRKFEELLPLFDLRTAKTPKS